MVAKSYVSTPRNHSPCNIWSTKPIYQLLEFVLHPIYNHPILNAQPFLYFNSCNLSLCKLSTPSPHFNTLELLLVQLMLNLSDISSLAIFLCASSAHPLHMSTPWSHY